MNWKIFKEKAIPVAVSTGLAGVAVISAVSVPYNRDKGHELIEEKSRIIKEYIDNKDKTNVSEEMINCQIETIDKQIKTCEDDVGAGVIFAGFYGLSAAAYAGESINKIKKDRNSLNERQKRSIPAITNGKVLKGNVALEEKPKQSIMQEILKNIRAREIPEPVQPTVETTVSQLETTQMNIPNGSQTPKSVSVNNSGFSFKFGPLAFQQQESTTNVEFYSPEDQQSVNIYVDAQGLSSQAGQEQSQLEEPQEERFDLDEFHRILAQQNSAELEPVK